MKTVLVAVMLIGACALPVHAVNLGVGASLGVSHDDRREDERRSRDTNETRTMVTVKGEARFHEGYYNRIKSWVVDAGTTGEVTATSSNSLKIKTATGDSYTVLTTDATVRRGKESVDDSTIEVGEKVYVMGIQKDSEIVASLIIGAKSSDDLKPSDSEKQRSILGVITAKGDNSLSIVSSNKSTYTVLTADADIWINKDKQTSLQNLAVGNKVMVRGAVSGSKITAADVLLIHLPEGSIAGKITAIDGDTITVRAADEKTYTVMAADADIRTKKESDASTEDLKIGTAVVVKGDLDGTTLSADSVTEARANVGFFHRFGLFFKSLFGKK